MQGTLLISNILLILFCLIYGFLIIKKKVKEDSQVWLSFITACALFFISQLLNIYQEFFGTNTEIITAIINIFFTVVILYAFITKYDSLSIKK